MWLLRRSEHVVCVLKGIAIGGCLGDLRIVVTRVFSLHLAVFFPLKPHIIYSISILKNVIRACCVSYGFFEV